MRIHFPFPRHLKTRFIELEPALCRACWQCVAICPSGVIGKTDLRFHQHAHIDYSAQCKGCIKCVTIYAHKAIRYIYAPSANTVN